MGQENNENFNADELVAPTWMNAEFFRKVLSDYEQAPELNVLNVEMSPASGKGDHFASIMFRGKVSYSTNKGQFSKSLIIKTMPEVDGFKKDFLKDSYIFQTEIGMYTKVLPHFESILREAGDDTKLCVQCIYHSLEPRQVMIFDDLVPQGYEVVRNRYGTNEELKAGFLKLAKMQAVSYKILKENPEYLKEFKNGVFSMPITANQGFLTKGVGNFIEFLEKVPELSKYVPYFKSIEHNYFDSYRKIVEEYRENWQHDGYYVLCHGDYHLRNMMFKYGKDDGKLEDCMLLDFQMSNVCPITVDVIYSIYMLLGPEQRLNNYKELINFFFNSFVETLEKIGFKGELPNRVDFSMQISRHKIFEIFYLTTFLPMTYGIASQAFDIPEMLENNDVRKKSYFIEGYVEEVKVLLSRFEKLGYFK